MADNAASGSLLAAWDGVTPATAPAGSIVLLAPGRDATIGIDVRGTFAATITLETSVDGLNWSAPSVTTITGVASTATFTTPGSRLIAVSGAALLRARCSAYTSGTATVTMAGTPGGGGGSGGGGGGGAATIADGADVAQGTTTDAGIITDTSGTVIGFLRGAILRWNTFLGRFPAALGATTAANSLPVTLSTDGQFVTATGSITETAPATDTASSGLNGRLQRVAQRLTSLIGQLPSAPISNRLDVNLGAAPATVTAQGTAAAGTAPSGNPLAMGITDGTNIQYAKASADGTNSLLVAAAISGAGADGVTNVSTIKNAGGGTTPLSVAPSVYNGTTQDRARSIAGAQATTGTGLPGVGPLHQSFAHGANPTAVAAGQYQYPPANRAGVPFVIGGHPNIQTFAQNFTAAQTDTAIVTVATGLKIVVTRCKVHCSNANTVNVSYRLGFGTTTVPAYGNAGILESHPNCAPGSGSGSGGGSGIIGVGTDDQDVRFTCSVPTGGSCDVMISYHTIES